MARILNRNVKVWSALPAPLLICTLIAGSNVITASSLISDLETRTTSFACDGEWQIVPAVDAVTRTNDYNSLNAVGALSATDVWAVGNFHRFSDAADKT